MAGFAGGGARMIRLMDATAHGARAIVAKLKRQLEELYGPRLSRVVLIGSQARGDATEDSDIDVLIVLKGSFRPREERRRTLDAIAELSLEHDVVIADVIASEHDYIQGTAPLYAAARREGIPL
jgi:predicted nucleotidyltransferase